MIVHAKPDMVRAGLKMEVRGKLVGAAVTVVGTGDRGDEEEEKEEVEEEEEVAVERSS